MACDSLDFPLDGDHGERPGQVISAVAGGDEDEPLLSGDGEDDPLLSGAILLSISSTPALLALALMAVTAS